MPQWTQPDQQAVFRDLLDLQVAPCPLLQEFVELVRAGKMLEAITYARQHLAQWAGSHMQELQVTTRIEQAHLPVIGCAFSVPGNFTALLTARVHRQ